MHLRKQCRDRYIVLAGSSVLNGAVFLPRDRESAATEASRH